MRRRDPLQTARPELLMGNASKFGWRAQHGRGDDVIGVVAVEVALRVPTTPFAVLRDVPSKNLS